MHEKIRILRLVQRLIASIFLCDLGWQGQVLKIFKKCLFFSIFSTLGPILQIYWQVMEQFILEFHEIIRMSHVIACLVIFILFYDLDQQGGVFKLMKNDHFIVFLLVWNLSQVFKQVKEKHISEVHEMIRAPYELRSQWILIYFVIEVKPTKSDHFQIFLAILVLFFKF